MQQSQIILSFLVPTNKNGPITVQPAVTALYDPAPRFVALFVLDGFSLLIPTDNVGSVMPLLTIITNYFAVITFVQAQMLRLIFSYLWSLHHNAVVSQFKQLTIIAVSGGQTNPDGRTPSVYPDTPFGSKFSSVSRIWPGFFPHPVGLYLKLHRVTANASLSF